MQAAGEITELVERAGQLVTYLVHIGADVGRHPVADTAQHERLGHQSLLDAVVQIPFDPAAHLIAHGEDPAAGSGQLGRELLDLTLPFRPAPRRTVPPPSRTAGRSRCRAPGPPRSARPWSLRPGRRGWRTGRMAP